MTRDEILELVKFLPKSAPIFASTSPIEGLSQHIELVYQTDQALTCEYFGWAWIAALVAAKLPFPKSVTNEALKRGYRWETGKSKDPNVVLALRYGLRERRIDYALICGALLQGQTYEEVAKALSEDPDVIMLADQFFLNIRDRLNDPPYIRGIVYKFGTQEELAPTYLSTVDPSKLILRAHYKTDNINAARWQAGLLPGHKVVRDGAAVASSLESNTMNEASLLMQTIGGSVRAPVVGRALQMMTDNKASGTLNAAGQVQHNMGTAIGLELQARDDNYASMREEDGKVLNIEDFSPVSKPPSFEEIKASASS